MFNWRESADDILEQGEIFCLVTITAAQGSTPRDAGTVMLVTSQNTYGTIGGGNLELAAIDVAHECLMSNGGHPRTLDYILGPDAEQCCGGRVELFFRKITSRSELPDIPVLKSFPIYVFGAGHVGQAVFTALTPLPFAVHLYDNRNDKVFGEVLVFSEPLQTVRDTAKNAYFLIMTHDHNLDYELVSAVLRRDDFAFLGLIGSKTKRARFISRLKKDGITEAQLSRLTCPIGIDGIQGKEPEIIAASVAAQLLQKLGESDGY